MSKENEEEKTVARPIRPTTITFKTEEERQAFINWANSREKTSSPEHEEIMKHVRKELNEHQRSSRLDKPNKSE